MRTRSTISIVTYLATFGCAILLYLPLATMLQAHLELRQQMSHDLNANVISDLSVDALYQFAQRNMRKVKQGIWRKSILYGMVERWLYSLSPKTAWLGDYAPFVRRRQQQG
ncbi:MAG: hypothetical protein SFY66_13430 [Oculatellaceae cyanobacterium bins.114]|nr:hypothetical protein [Oculatellaceae cyanobacterium bins.114]